MWNWIPSFAGMTEKKLSELQAVALDFCGATAMSALDYSLGVIA
jgi:hypothetical protein